MGSECESAGEVLGFSVVAVPVFDPDACTTQVAAKCCTYRSPTARGKMRRQLGVAAKLRNNKLPEPLAMTPRAMPRKTARSIQMTGGPSAAASIIVALGRAMPATPAKPEMAVL